MSPVDPVASVIKPTSYIGIHSTDESTNVYFVSEGCYSAVGYKPSELINTRAKDYIADSMDQNDYSQLYAKADSDEIADEPDEDSNVYSMWVNIKSARGAPVLHRIISFRCDNTVIYLGMTFPERPFTDHPSLQVQQLDRQMQKLDVSRSPTRQQRKAFVTRSRQAKCALVLDNYVTADPDQLRVNGPVVTFSTTSVDRVLDVDYSDLVGYPFLKLVAPEDVLHVTKFLVRLAATTDVLFERFALLSRPRVIAGDVAIADEDHPRVLVECLGAATSNDGVVLLLRRLRTMPAPRPETVGDYVHARIDADDDDDEDSRISLLDILTTDPETSDAGDGWTQFL
ncbi:hypothetical protein IWW55_002256 [Coemansia sp. RSA 2706]|nr:hypothetical protein IWW55_002256 [Coemansia sp. RSA 2706]KAJ2313063.1 hypothetical protein IWW54_001730 [Coemansia sp. RSA 2705]KAJ2320548.1 hypothetical protein IWW52_001302 [Coemansia sp. RSA 2704]KAJ2328194.1 hypothetical protein IWW51_001329 [Coemansia sp. RSA 2702]KAJ2369694.1 hypothetical protein H4S01_000844 [Coemansia sp. RSA 2610]KAJ2385063.1 hypothetical protein H4S02_004520 [Coemansia sp. RSA 2611]KAJ2738678.1 hypothetical protein H4R23_000985 [Coemansia sp. Cherry 401B]